MSTMPGRRLYIGRLTPDVRESDLEDLFKGYGKITDLRLMGTFGFAEWEKPEDAEDVVKDFNGKSFMGDSLKIEFAKDSRRQQRPPAGYPPPPPPGYYDDYYSYYGYGRGGGGGGGRYPPPPPGYGPPPQRREPNIKRGQYRLLVSNLPPNTSWQDLKDIAREYGRVSFTDVNSSRPEEGIIEYDNRDDFERALDRIEGTDLRGNKLRIDPAEKAPPADDRYGDSRGGGGRVPPPARERSRSPIPRRYEDSRELPPRRYDDSRRGDDDREPPSRGYDSRSPPRGGYD